MEIIKNETRDEERAFYHLTEAKIEKCSFDGPADGESALKECRNIEVNDCFFNLRYPLWHDQVFCLNNCSMTPAARAALWYSNNGKIKNSKLEGVKCLRECSNIEIENTRIVSPEFGWKCKNVSIANSELEAEYCLFGTDTINIKNLNMKGKYSFQYTKDLTAENCNFDTKDAFWHSHNVTVKDSTIKGEYLAWYSDGLTLINCKIIGTQPLCYCTNLKLVNCTMEGCDLSFEYSEVEADIRGEVLSVKNPKSGKIVADSYGEIIKEDAVYRCDCEIVTR